MYVSRSARMIPLIHVWIIHKYYQWHSGSGFAINRDQTKHRDFETYMCQELLKQEANPSDWILQVLFGYRTCHPQSKAIKENLSYNLIGITCALFCSLSVTPSNIFAACRYVTTGAHGLTIYQCFVRRQPRWRSAPLGPYYSISFTLHFNQVTKF